MSNGNGTDYTREVQIGDNPAVEVQVLPINEIEFLSVTDAVRAAKLSRAYINKALNAGTIAGMQLPGLGWLAQLESLETFATTSRRAPGKATVVAQALEAFLRGMGDDVWEQWERIEAATIAEYKEKKEAADAEEEDEELETA
jgi:hypothetical protein